MIQNARMIIKRVGQSSRALFCASLLLALLIVSTFVTAQTDVVLVSDSSRTTAVLCVGSAPESILQKQGISVGPGDLVTAKSHAAGGLQKITIQRAFPVAVQVEGGETVVWTTEATVRSVLETAGIPLGEEDVVVPARGELVEEGAIIAISRVTYAEAQHTEEVPYGTQYEETSLLGPGRTQLQSEGRNGEKLVTTRTRLVDGTPEGEPQVVAEEVTVEPVDEVVLKGKERAMVSTLRFGDVPIGDDGIPLSYSRVMKGAITTGYSVKPGQGTASGRKPVPGIVAVDPSKIPYGTRMYIVSSDGSFVYGYAIAGETGSAMKEGRVDFDLLYATYAQSCAHGKRALDVYFLD